MKKFHKLFETQLGGWANPVSGTTITGTKTATNTTGMKPSANRGKIEPIDVQKMISSLEDQNSKAPKILPGSLDTISDELIYAYGRLQGVAFLLWQAENDVMFAKKKSLVKHLKYQATRARLIVDNIYKQLGKLTL